MYGVNSSFFFRCDVPTPIPAEPVSSLRWALSFQSNLSKSNVSVCSQQLASPIKFKTPSLSQALASFFFLPLSLAVGFSGQGTNKSRTDLRKRSRKEKKKKKILCHSKINHQFNYSIEGPAKGTELFFKCIIAG